MTRLDYLEVAICIALYIPLGLQILRGTVVQNFATWFLWTVLDGITAVSIIVQHGNFVMISIFTCGGAAISLCILKSKNFSWSKFETFTAAMAIACMAVWAMSGPRNATIAGTAAVVIAAFPTVKHAYQMPRENSLLTWSGFTIVNVMGLVEGKDWSVEQRLYPLSCLILCFLLVALTARKLWVPKPALPIQEEQ